MSNLKVAQNAGTLVPSTSVGIAEPLKSAWLQIRVVDGRFTPNIREPTTLRGTVPDEGRPVHNFVDFRW